MEEGPARLSYWAGLGAGLLGVFLRVLAKKEKRKKRRQPVRSKWYTDKTLL